VPGAQFCVHIVAEQLGARAAGAHVVGWQQVAATQSSSRAHSAPGDAAPPLGRSSRTSAPPRLIDGGRSFNVPDAGDACRPLPD
jgi:hypothetical protein